MRLSVVCFMFFYEFKHNAFVHCLGAWFHAFFHIITNVYAPFVHKKAMEKKCEKDPDAYHWLRDNKKLGLWATCKFDTILKCDDNTSNFI